MPQRMPALFFGHGNPMNALLVNPYTEQWAALGAGLRIVSRPQPKNRRLRLWRDKNDLRPSSLAQS
jgi:hypothetical protein